MTDEDEKNIRNRKKFIDIEFLDRELNYLYRAHVYKPERYRKIIDQSKSYNLLTLSKKERAIFLQNIINISEEMLDITNNVMYALERFIKSAKEGNTFIHQKLNKIISDYREIKKRIGLSDTEGESG